MENKTLLESKKPQQHPQQHTSKAVLKSEQKITKGKASDKLLNMIDVAVKHAEGFRKIIDQLRAEQAKCGLTDSEIRQLVDTAARRLGYTPRWVQRLLPLELKNKHMSNIGKSGADKTNEIKKQKKLELVSQTPQAQEHTRMSRGVVNLIESTEAVEKLIDEKIADKDKELRETMEMLKRDQDIINTLKEKLRDKNAAQKIKFFLPDLQRSLKVFEITGKRYGYIVTDREGTFKELAES